MTPAELRDLYDRELRRRLEVLEPLRKQIARGRLGGPLVKLCGLLALGAPVFSGGRDIDAMITVLLAPASLGLAIYLFLVKPAQRQTSLYCRRFKAEVLSEVIQKLAPGARFEAGGEDVRGGGDATRSGLFAAPDFLRHRAEDHLSGTLGETAWHSADLYLYEPSDQQLGDSGREQRVFGRSRPRTLFRGFFLQLTLQRSFAAHTIVESRGARAAATLEHAALDVVALSDTDFDAAFTVKTSSAEEAKALLRPTLRAKLLALRRDVGRPLLLSFAEKHAWLAVPFDGDLFEPEMRERTSPEAIQVMVGLLESARILASETADGVKVARAPGAMAAAETGNAPPRPTRSLIRVRRGEDGLQIDYLGSVSLIAVALTGLAAPAVCWFWLLWVQALRGASDYDSSGILFVALPLFLFTLVWFFFAQNWWRPAAPGGGPGRGQRAARRLAPHARAADGARGDPVAEDRRRSRALRGLAPALAATTERRGAVAPPRAADRRAFRMIAKAASASVAS